MSLKIPVPLGTIVKRKCELMLLEELTSAGQIPVVDGELELGSNKCLDMACVAFRGRRKKDFRAQPLKITVSLGTIVTHKRGGRGFLLEELTSAKQMLVADGR